MSTPRAPSIDHNAISTAPVSDAGTIPKRQSTGILRIDLERVIISFSRAFGSAARWLRPRKAPDSASSVKPGRFAHGPDEKLGLAGRMSGVAALAIAVLPYRRKASRWGDE